MDFGKLISFVGLVFLLLTLVANILPNWPKIPGDIYIEKPGIRIYIPFASALIISAIISLIFNFFIK